MISAVVMAGYNNKWAVRRYAKSVAEHYGEKFIETGYKPLREFETLQNGRLVSKPLIQFTLEKLAATDQIGDIVIVGHRMLLEQRLRKVIRGFDKPCKIINQNTRISPEAIRRFRIQTRKVKHNSIAGNMIKGYEASTAFEPRSHALFVAADSPLTTRRYIEYFLGVAAEFQADYDIIVPGVLIEGNADKLGRTPLKLINDTGLKLSDEKDAYGRQGYRLSSLMFANPHGFDVNTANTAYNLRKCVNPNVQLKLFRVTRSLGYANVYSKYFLRRDLSISEVENITSAFFGGRLKIIPVRDVESSYDYDGTDIEYFRISEILRSREPDDEEPSSWKERSK